MPVVTLPFLRLVPPHRRRTHTLLAALTLSLAPLASPAFAPVSAASVGAAQLTVTTDQTAAYLNGESTRLVNSPRLIGGRTMLPLRETAALLGQPLTIGTGQLQLGRLVIDTRSNAATLGGQLQPEGNVVSSAGTLYVTARLISDALNANMSVDDSGRTLTLTALRGGGNPLAPQARFSTDKNVYAPGERVVFTEYPFDPDGSDIVARRWTGRQEAYFQPGTYTVGLQVTNARGLQSTAFTRTIRVEGLPIDSPLTYALKYADPGEAFPDPGVVNYPVVTPQVVDGPSIPLLFSDSPEAPTQRGRARLLAYHLNALGKPARLYVLARNTENRPVEVRTERLGETAPTRIEGLLGQVTLLDYFAHTGSQTLTLSPGQSAAVYASPTLGMGSGVNLMQDVVTTGRVELTFLMVEDTLPVSGQLVQQLPYLPSDGRHVRGTFPEAVRTLRVNLTSLPARIVIGDGMLDPAITGTDMLTGQSVRLMGNYGVLYDLEVNGAAGTAVALSPRGGLYRGAMNVTDGPLVQTIKLPRTGAALMPNQPVMLWRPQTDRLNIDFVPASGSNLPISLVFYNAKVQGGFGGIIKTYQP
jgi:PKD repeat protein